MRRTAATRCGRRPRATGPTCSFWTCRCRSWTASACWRRWAADGLPQVVFVTAYDQYAIQAFEVHALDYLLKPYTPARLSAAVQRAAARCAAPRASAGGPAGGAAGAPGARAARAGARLDGVPARARARRAAPHTRTAAGQGRGADVLCPRGADRLAGGGGQLRAAALRPRGAPGARRRSAGWRSSWTPRRFTRIHRSTIVNLDRVKEVRPWFAGDYLVKLHDGAELRLSRRYRDRLL